MLARPDQKPPAISLKALGKRRLVSPLVPHHPNLTTTTTTATTASGNAATAPSAGGAGGSAAAAAAGGAKERVVETEKRVTRSSLGGNTPTDSQPDPSGAFYLPPRTPILLTSHPAPRGLLHRPRPKRERLRDPLTHFVELEQTSPAAPSSPPRRRPVAKKTGETTDEGVEEEQDDALEVLDEELVPSFRLLEPWESFGRSRHGPAEHIDTSDAHYHRLHRFPEILEKRSARLEREKLIHERSKLILEIEELRGRGWVYTMGNTGEGEGKGRGLGRGGKGEEERRKKLKASEERLKRYDALLPNQPRKSRFLTTTASGSLSHPATISRSGSPDPYSKARQSTPLSLSASAEGGTRIKIKFGGVSTTTGASQKQKKGKKRNVEMEFDDDSEEDEEEEEEDDDDSEEGHVHHKKRARKSSKKEPHPKPYFYQSERSKKSHHRRTSPKTTDDLSAGEWEDDLDDLVYEGRSRSHPSLVPKSKRLPGSFFSSAALRDSVLIPSSTDPNSTNPNPRRRSSSRVSYAFGTRVPELALMKEREFMLFGGVDTYLEPNGIPLEELAKRRVMQGVEELDEDARMDGAGEMVVNGVLVPKSAYAVFMSSPPEGRKR